MKKIILIGLIIVMSCYAGCGKQLQQVQDTQISMDTAITVSLTGNDTKLLQDDLQQVFGLWQTISEETDRFNGTVPNGVTMLNKRQGTGPFVLGDHVFRLVQLAKNQPYRQFDITLAPVADVWQRHKESKTVPTPNEVKSALDLCGPQVYSLDVAQHSITLRPGSALDLGAIAKGYAVDEAYKLLKTKKEVKTALINAGGNIRVLGSKGAQEPWKIGVQYPRKAQELMGTITLEPGQAVATSGDYQRYYEIDGVRYHHILDATTGYPCHYMQAVTVLAPVAVTADFFSTLLFTMPVEEALKLVEETPGLAAVLVDAQGQIRVSSKMEQCFVQQ